MTREEMAAHQNLRDFEEGKKDHFDAWMKRPEIKIIVSMLPPCETDAQRECFGDLLRASFNSGYDAGGAGIGMMLMKKMFRSVEN